MFIRNAGWHLTTGGSGNWISHYFRSNQTKALCGNAENTLDTVAGRIPIKGTPHCKRCFKYYQNQQLTGNKK